MDGWITGDPHEYGAPIIWPTNTRTHIYTSNQCLNTLASISLPKTTRLREYIEWGASSENDDDDAIAQVDNDDQSSSQSQSYRS